VTSAPRDLPLVAVLGVVGVGLAGGAAGYWRTGATVAGLGLLLGAVLRATLPPHRAGLLAVRGRRLDTAVLVVLGLAVVVLAVSVPVST
jgi:hypothetical protein